MPLREFLQKDTFPWRVLVAAILICGAGGFHYGYQATCINPSETVLREFVNESYYRHYGNYIEGEETFRILWSAVIVSQPLGGLLGALVLAKLAEKLGRHKTFYVSSTFTLIGLLCQSLSKLAFSFELLIIGRFITAVGVSMSLLLEGMYLIEISPIPLRGFFTSIMGIFILYGQLLGAILALSSVLGTETLWPWLFVVEMAPVIILLFALPFLHESPRFLYSRGKLEECKKALKFFNHKDIDGAMREIEEESKSDHEKLTLKELWKRKYLRKTVFLCILIALAANQSGINYVSFLSTNILENIGMPESTAQYAAVIIFGPAFLASFFCSALIEKAGRRSLMIWTTIILTLSNVCLFAFSLIYELHEAKWAGYASMAACIAYCLALGAGPIALQWIMVAEMTPQDARSSGQSTVLTVQKTLAVIETFTFYPVQGVIGAYVFLFYIVSLCGYLAFFIPMLPETKNKSIGEIVKKMGGDGDETGENGRSETGSTTGCILICDNVTIFISPFVPSLGLKSTDKVLLSSSVVVQNRKREDAMIAMSFMNDHCPVGCVYCIEVGRRSYLITCGNDGLWKRTMCNNYCSQPKWCKGYCRS